MGRKSGKLRRACLLCTFFLFTAAMNVSAETDIRSDLKYDFTNKTETEFYQTGTAGSQYNITGEIPGYLYDIYEFTPQPVYNSDFGTNIVLPGGDFDTYPAGNKPYYAPDSAYSSNPATPTQSAGGTGAASSQSSQLSQTSSGTTGNTSAANSSVSYPSYSAPSGDYPDFTFEEEKNNPYPATSIDKVRNADGSIGTLSIKKIGLTITAYDGDTFDAMLKGVGHISSTSAWNGNVGLVGHNRGVTNNFGKLKELAAGDEVQYTTKLGTRKYKVISVESISEMDWSKLQYTTDNRLTLITCIENVSGVRLCVQCIEIG